MRVVLFGASGAAGAAVLDECIADSRIGAVIAVLRRPMKFASPKVRVVVWGDFKDFSGIAADLVDVRAVYYCLGVSQSQVSERSTYVQITYDYAMSAARAIAKASPGAVFHFLSGAGTNSRGAMMWAQVKGQTEEALRTVQGLGGVVCYRPGYIHPTQPREGRQFAERLIRPLFPVLHSFRRLAISAPEFGRAMLQTTFDGARDGVLENRDLRTLAERYAVPNDRA